MLRMDPDQLPRLIQIEQNTHDLLSEAKEKGWDGEAAGLEVTLLHISDKKAQVDRIRRLPLIQLQFQRSWGSLARLRKEEGFADVGVDPRDVGPGISHGQGRDAIAIGKPNV